MLRVAFLLLSCLAGFVCSFAYGEAPLTFGEHTVVLNGVRLWYRVAGQPKSGEMPLLYLAGGPGYNTYSFEHTIGPQLERHTQLVYFDQRGTGHSERPPTNDYAMPILIQDMEALRRHLRVRQISLMGHSFGATVAVEYAARYPKHVQKLVVVDGAEDLPQIFDLWSTEIQERYPAAWKEVSGGAAENALRTAQNHHDIRAVAQASFEIELVALSKVDAAGFRNWQQFHDQQYQKAQAELDSVSGLKNTGEVSKVYFSPGADFICYQFRSYDKLTMPVLVIVGRYDGAVGIEQMRDFASRLSHARFDEFADSGHFPYAEEPSKFAGDVAAFLQDY